MRRSRFSLITTSGLILKASRKGRCQFDAYQTDAEPSLAVKYQFGMSLMSH
jgi:hypothetical protein